MIKDIKVRNLDEIRLQIEKIRQIDLKVVDFLDIYKEVNVLLNGYTIVQFPGYQFIIYRARINESRKLFKAASDLWAPKSKEMSENRFGRANKPQDPVFYCSNNEEIAVSELPIKVGDWITIMRCCSRGDLFAMKSVGLGFKDEVVLKSKDGTNSLKWGDYKEEKIRKLYIKHHGNDTIAQECLLKNKLIDEFLNLEFRKEIHSNEYNYEYKITAAIASLYLDSNPLSSVRMDAISYPSIRDDQSAGPNWAFTIEAASKFYKCDSFETVEIGKIEKNGKSTNYYGNVRFKSDQISSSGDIIWDKFK
ncbi:MAG: hypothetical protein WC394_04765 [Candidatus Omnitrophota bacterium]|jgi:hypothetical protein